MDNSTQFLDTKRWVRPWNVKAGSPDKFDVWHEDVDFIYALRFTGNVPDTLTVVIGGSPTVYKMHNRTIWNACVIPVGKLRYHRVQFVLPEECTFDEVEVLVSAKSEVMQPNLADVFTRYLCVWYDHSDANTKKYNWLVYSSGMGAMYLVKDSHQYTGYESAQALRDQDEKIGTKGEKKVGAIQPNYSFDDQSLSNFLEWW